MSIVTLTMNPVIDKSSEVDRVVAERKLRCEPPSFEPGGGGINVARAIRRLGGDAVALFPSGGPPGELLGRLLREDGVTHRPIDIDGWTRENLAVYETSTGQQYRFGMPGPRLGSAEWERCLEAVGGLDPAPDYLVASGSLPPGVPPDFYAQLARACTEQGSRLVVDTSGEALKLTLTAGVFLIKPNLREMEAVAGADIEDESHLEEVVRDLVGRKCCRYVVVSLGSAGVLAAGDDELRRVRAPTVKIRSKVGAGDSSVAGIVHGLEKGMAFMDAVRYGVAAGAAAVMTPGSELCRREDVEELYGKIAAGS